MLFEADAYLDGRHKASTIVYAIEASTVEASSVEAGSVEAGSVEAGSVEAGSVEAGSVESAPCSRRGNWQP
jgi:hypothetical protein